MKTTFRRLIASIFEQQVRRLITRHNLRVVAVAGSVGKTTTRLAIAAVLSQKYRIQSITQPGYNSEIGLPLSVFEMEVPGILINPFAWIWRLIQTELIIRGHYLPKVLVLELGTEEPGEMARYLDYIKPEIGVMTAVTPEHMQNFPGGLDDVAAEELLLAAASKRFVAGFDDIKARHRHQYIDKHADHYYYGLNPEIEYAFRVGRMDITHGSKGDFLKNGHIRIKAVQLDVFGPQLLKATAAAYAVADLMGLTEEQIRAGLANFHPLSGRMNRLPGIGGSVIIDDSYNAQPDAVLAALDALAQTHPTGRRIAILGSMNELGDDTPRYHAEIGTAAAGVDMLVTVGEWANKHLGPAAVQAGLDERNWKPADSPYAAGEFLKLILGEGDILLVKGSQNRVFTEEAIKLLLANPADATKLVRQSDKWLAIKRAQFDR